MTEDARSAVHAIIVGVMLVLIVGLFMLAYSCLTWQPSPPPSLPEYDQTANGLMYLNGDACYVIDANTQEWLPC